MIVHVVQRIAQTLLVCIAMHRVTVVRLAHPVRLPMEKLQIPMPVPVAQPVAPRPPDCFVNRISVHPLLLVQTRYQIVVPTLEVQIVLAESEQQWTHIRRTLQFQNTATLLIGTC